MVLPSCKKKKLIEALVGIVHIFYFLFCTLEMRHWFVGVKTQYGESMHFVNWNISTYKHYNLRNHLRTVKVTLIALNACKMLVRIMMAPPLS